MQKIRNLRPTLRLEQNTRGLKTPSLANAEVQPRYPVCAVKQDPDLREEGSRTRFLEPAMHEQQAQLLSVDNKITEKLVEIKSNSTFPCDEIGI